MNVLDFKKKKDENKKITMVTCYDYSSAKIVERSRIDCVLVGDSLAMTMHGFPNTTMATMDMMVMHTQAVARGIESKFLIGDMPFLSYRKSLSETLLAVERFIQAGAHAVKLEGAEGNLDIIQHIVASGVPVMGHLGLTPQAIHAMGGHKVQGRAVEAAEKIMRQARQLEAAGCFSIVLECVPLSLARKITGMLSIPTIGIGAGPFTDGQVLVFQDLLGLQDTFNPKFLKTYLNGVELVQGALDRYVEEVQSAEFPNPEEHCF